MAAGIVTLFLDSSDSDQGSHNSSLAFGLRCKKADFGPSSGSARGSFDNAVSEGFFAIV